MKLTKILAIILALISVLSMLVACDGNPDETPAPIDPSQTKPRHKAVVTVQVLDYKGKLVYETDPEEPYEYDSGYSEPYIFTFLEDFAFMNSKEFAYKANKYTTGKDENGEDIVTYVLQTISITQKKKTKDYKAGEKIVSEYDGSEQETYWVCFVNGEEVDNMNETLLKDGDTVVFRLAYKDSDKVTTKIETLPDIDDATQAPDGETNAPESGDAA